MSYETQTRSAEHVYARTNRELFRPRESTGNPQYDFYTHYSRLSGLERLSLETHTVNGTQISRYEPDISHSTTCVNAPGFVDLALERARQLLCGACLVSFLGTSTLAFATAGGVREALSSIDAGRVEEAAQLLSTDTNTPEFVRTRNRRDALVGNAPVLVLRESGSLIQFPSSYTRDKALADYEETRRGSSRRLAEVDDDHQGRGGSHR